MSQLKGSPPRMRGNAIRERNARQRQRITPAHAGKSPGELRNRRGVGDHPRACGEKSLPFALDGHFIGSPPRMRGKEKRVRREVERGGITPAHAGKSCQDPRTSDPPRDHPHACGEKRFAMQFKHCHEGSPPRMRGKVKTAIDAAIGSGITPAHAGKRPGSACRR